MYQIVSLFKTCPWSHQPDTKPHLSVCWACSINNHDISYVNLATVSINFDSKSNFISSTNPAGIIVVCLFSFFNFYYSGFCAFIIIFLLLLDRMMVNSWLTWTVFWLRR
jgi:hypothetical protein